MRMTQIWNRCIFGMQDKCALNRWLSSMSSLATRAVLLTAPLEHARLFGERVDSLASKVFFLSFMCWNSSFCSSRPSPAHFMCTCASATSDLSLNLIREGLGCELKVLDQCNKILRLAILLLSLEPVGVASLDQKSSCLISPAFSLINWAPHQSYHCNVPRTTSNDRPWYGNTCDL